MCVSLSDMLAQLPMLPSSLSPFFLLIFFWVFALPPIAIVTVGAVALAAFRRVFHLAPPSPPVILLRPYLPGLGESNRDLSEVLVAGVAVLGACVLYVGVVHGVIALVSMLGLLGRLHLVLDPLLTLVGLLVPVALCVRCYRHGTYEPREAAAYALFFVLGGLLVLFLGVGAIGRALDPTSPVGLATHASLLPLAVALAGTVAVAVLLQRWDTVAARSGQLAAAGALLAVVGLGAKLAIGLPSDALPHVRPLLVVSSVPYVTGLFVFLTAMVFVMTEPPRRSRRVTQ